MCISFGIPSRSIVPHIILISAANIRLGGLVIILRALYYTGFGNP